MPKPTLSIVIATHNRAKFLPELLHSLESQLTNEIEVIIVDDASQDNTQEVLLELQGNYSSVKIIHLEENVGPGTARNTGINVSKGRFIAIQDDDDLPHPNRFSQQKKMLETYPDVDITFSSVAWINHNKEVFNIFPGIMTRHEFPQNPDEVFKLLYTKGNKIPNTTLMVRREVIEKHGGYPEYPRIGEDWFLCMKWAALGKRMLVNYEPLVYQLRDLNHFSLMKNANLAIEAQRIVLKMIRNFLKEHQIQRFDALHKLAFSNQYVREARIRSRFHGIYLCLYALSIMPGNAYAWDTLHWLIRKGVKKIFPK